MNFDHLRRRAAVVRQVPLQDVLIRRGAVRDVRDRAKWHTEQGSLSVTGPKFRNWQRGTGGGGAIDLVMHLAQLDFASAVAWLEQQLALGHLTAEASLPYSGNQPGPVVDQQDRPLRLPLRDDRLLPCVRDYLARRRLRPALFEPLIKSGQLYADGRGNAVFLLVAGKRNDRSARNYEALGSACGVAWLPVPARMQVTSGSASPAAGLSSSANQRSMRSAACRFIRSTSASPRRGCAPTRVGSAD